MKRTILLVEDDPDVRETIEMLLGEWFPEADIHSFGDGARALAAIKRLRPKLVVTDLKMPFVSGRDLAGTAGQLGDAARFVVITGSVDATLEDLQQANPAVVALIRKPFESERLRSVCRSALGFDGN